MNETQEQAVIRQYLLGYSNTDIAESIEQRLVASDEYLQEFLIVTDELIEDYLVGNLSGDEANRFETHFLTTPRRHRKLEIARALFERAMSDAPSDSKSADSDGRGSGISRFPPRAAQRQYWQIAAAVSVVLFVGLVAWVILRNRPAQNISGEMEAELGRLNSPGQQAPSGPSVQLSIFPITVRGLEEDRRVFVQPDTQTVWLRLVLVDKVYDNYQASIQTVEGKELGEIPLLKAVSGGEGQFIEVRLPAQLLQSQSYRIKLTALTSSYTYEDVGVYTFQIIKRS